MNDPAKTDYDWNPIAHVLPAKEDFGRGLDEAYAWKQFGGMPLDEAYRHFLKSPECRQEDFMFMGPTAFLFYFPVIERYLYTVQAEHELDDCQAWILAKGITAQVENRDVTPSKGLIVRVAKLVDHVLRNPNQYAPTMDEQERVLSAWKELREVIEKTQK